MPDLQGLVSTIDALERWLRERDYAGIDPFDGLSGNHIPRALLQGARTRQAVVQAAKRSPVDLRPLLGVRPGRMAKAAGLIASGYARLEEAGWGGPARERATGLLEWLQTPFAHGADPRAWGYEFDVQTRWAFYPAGTPNIIVTTFVANAFLDWHERSEDPAFLAVAKSAADYLCEVLLVEDRGRSYFAYVPGVTTLIHNANLLGCGFVARVAHVCGDEGLAAIARGAAAVTVEAQDSQGFWPYGEGPHLEWVDGFHTAYVLGGLYDVWRTTGDDKALASLKKGMSAYIEGLFAQDGVPKYSSVSLYPVDIHSAASAITVLLRAAEVDERSEGLARRVARWTIANLYDPTGYFYYQKTRWYTNRIPYVRWSQAHMFAALGALAAAPRP